MDSDEDIIQIVSNRKFNYEIHFSETVDPFNRRVFWKHVEDQLTNNSTPDNNLHRKLEKVHIIDGKWEDEDPEDEVGLPQATTFWSWVTRIMTTVGPYVKELHIELAEEGQDHDDNVKIREMKVKFLTSMADLFPNLKALKLTGPSMPADLEAGHQRAYTKIVNNTKVMMTVEYLDVNKKFSSSYLCSLIQKQILCGPMLTEVKASAYQLGFRRPQQCCVLESVKTLHLTDYSHGYDDSYEMDEFVTFFLHLFPCVSNLYIIDTMYDLPNLPKLLNGVNEKKQLKVFGIDYSTCFCNDSALKITGIPAIWLNLKDSSAITLEILEIIGDAPEVILENWETASMEKAKGNGTAVGPDEVKTAIVSVVKRMMPSLEKVTMISSQGVIQHVNLISISLESTVERWTVVYL